MKSVEWATPQDFFDTLNAEFNFGIDVCATPKNAKCRKFYTFKTDGLRQPWSGACWMNPPYDRDIDLWLRKAYDTAQEGATVVALLSGRGMDTAWWHRYVMSASEIRFVKGRLRFRLDGEKTTHAIFPSILVVFRPSCSGPPRTSSIDRWGRKIKEIPL